MVIVEESGMQFGEYPDNAVFCIEKSPQYRKHLMPNGVKTCEFILLKGSSLYFIEAKKTCPNQFSGDTVQKGMSKYNEYIRDIKIKVRHSLALYASILLERHSMDDIPPKMLGLV